MNREINIEKVDNGFVLKWLQKRSPKVCRREIQHGEEVFTTKEAVMERLEDLL